MIRSYSHLAFFWKWQHLLPNPAQTETFPVEGGGQVHLLHEDMGAAGLEAWLEERLPEAAECLVLAHQAKLPVQDLLPLQEKYKNRPALRFERFGGGKNYVYFNPNSDTGLIGQNGRWASEGVFETSDGRDVTPTLFDGSGCLRAYYFDPVWRYYRHHFKRRLYERKVLLLRALLRPLGNGHVVRVSNFLAQEEVDLDAQFKDLFGLVKGVYADKPALVSAMGALEDSFVKETIAQEQDLHSLNARFLAALHALPEPIY